jgi:hypothetical protein
VEEPRGGDTEGIMGLRKQWVLEFEPSKNKKFKSWFSIWIKKLFTKPFKPGLPPDAKLYNDSYVVNSSIQDEYNLYKRIYPTAKFPVFKGFVIVFTWWPPHIHVIDENTRIKNFMNSKQFRMILDEAETLTKEEISTHVVKDWDYLVEGFDWDEFLNGLARTMEKHLQNDGDVCMLPNSCFPEDCRVGLKNIGGTIRPFFASGGYYKVEDDPEFKESSSASGFGRMNYKYSFGEEEPLEPPSK